MFVEDITARRRELEPRIARLHALPLAARRTADGKQLEPELEAPTAEIDGLVSELQDLGCYFKGFQEGLVDWYSLSGGAAALPMSSAVRPTHRALSASKPQAVWSVTRAVSCASATAPTTPGTAARW